MRKYYTLLLLSLLAASCFGQMLRGKITDTEGNPLPFATVFLPDLQRGTASNVEGDYEIRLSAQRHTLRYQYLGYKSHQEVLDMRSGDVTHDVALEVEPVELAGVTVEAEREDPAYTIMRKAIAKAKYHTQQIDSFTATAYIKGSGRLKGLPGLFRKQIEKALEEEGVDTATAFTTESVSELSYKRPNQYSERVISVRTIGEDNNTSPVGFMQSSFYEADVNGSVSPLSPRAFAYYKFEYLGEFADHGHTINKIRVIPRSRGDKVFEGTIYIVDQLWSIHSLDLDTYIWGILFNINQIYQPFGENAWLPVNNIFNVNGSIFGFKFEYVYFANLSDYDITLNPELGPYLDVEIIDDKLAPDEAREADDALEDKEQTEAMEALSSGEEISRKQLRKMLKEYEKQEQQEWEQDTLEDVVMVSYFEVDSLAHTRDSLYWENIRPIPLTQYEERGYHVQDSIARAEQEAEEARQDTVSLTIGSESEVQVRSKSRFQVQDILLGGSYKVGESTRFALKSPIANSGFNTVDGYHFDWGVRLYGGRSTKWSTSPTIRYAFARKKVNYKIVNSLSGGPRYRKWAVVLEGGLDPVQINRDEPIHPFVNSFMSLLFERNYMRLYEKGYVLAGFQKDFSPKFKASVEAEWSHNKTLTNNSDFVIFNSDKREYMSNTPFNVEIGDAVFPLHNATTVDLNLDWRPWLKYRIRNNRKSIIDDSSPTLSLHIRGGFDGLLASQVSFLQVEGGFKHVHTFPAGGILNVNVRGGGFPSSNQVYFPQFKHFMGNRTPFATTDPVASFRMLDYYTFSTRSEYLTTHVQYQFRKLLATQIFEVRLLGVRENVFFNSLETNNSQHYFELGYGLNYIFRILRLELVTSWQDFRYQDFGVRIGIATNLDQLFN